MAWDEGEDRTEQPTPRRRQEAREQGRIARSPDLTAAVSILAGLLLLNAFGSEVLSALQSGLKKLGDDMDVSGTGTKTWLILSASSAARILLPFLLALMAAGGVASVLQSGWIVTWKKAAPSLEKLSPVAGLKRMFSTDAAVKLLMGVAKMGLVGAVAYMTIRDRMKDVLAAGAGSAGGVLAASGEIIYALCLKLGLILLILGLIDYFYQRWTIEKSLKMTKQEVRDEMKRMEGDPLMKQRRRQVQAKLAMQRLSTEVPKASVVVTNPTEYAVALRYDRETMSAPRVVAKGRDWLAMRIRVIAQQSGVPLVQRPPLARALYAACEPGEEIPAAHYRAVAEVLAYVMQLEKMGLRGAARTA